MNISSLIEEIEKSNLQIHLNKNDDLVIGNIRGHEHLVHKIKANKSSIVSFFKTERVRQFKEIKVISSEEAYYDLSHSQRRLWLIDQFGNTGVAYNISVVYDFAGINQEYFQRALINLISRHESLRTRFVQNKGNVRQVIEDTLDFSQVYSYIDLSAQPSSDLSSIMTEYVSQPFDLSKGPLIRCRLLKLDSDSYKVVLVLHHIISDGWSMNILERDFGLIYNSYLSGEVLDLPKLRIQYKDYAHWQNNEISQGGLVTDRSYWLTRLSGELPTLNLPTDYSRPSEMSYKGSTLRGLIPKESVVLLENLSHSYGGTLFMGLTTVLFGLLYRYSGQGDIILGTPIAGRLHPDLSDQVGCYVNTLCLRLAINGGDSFDMLLQRAIDMMLESYDHQNYPFDLLIEDLDVHHDLSRSPVFDIMVAKGEDMASEAAFKPNNDLQLSKFDMTVNFHKCGDDVLVQINYNSDIYSPHRIEQMIGHLRGFLSSVALSPVQELRYIEYMSSAERECLLEKFSGNRSEVNRLESSTILDVIRQNIIGNRDSIALVSGDRYLSYGLLETRSNQLANYLHAHTGLHSGDLIGIMLERTEWMIISILGILKAGFMYVPIDPSYPKSRKDYIIQDSGLKMVITDSSSESLPSEYIIRLPYGLDWGSLNSEYLAVDINSQDGAYVIYTSGSTGNPKGVMVEHGSLMNLCNWIISSVYDGKKHLKISLTASVSFDASVHQIFPSLADGQTLVLLDEHAKRNPGDYVNYLNKNAISVVDITPGFLDFVLRECQGAKLKIHPDIVLVGGEKLTNSIVKQFYSLFDEKINLINVYGPTEATVDSTFHEVNTNTNVSIGRPLPNVRVYLLDADDRLVPIGQRGEICISGDGVSRGYLNRVELTATKFVNNPFEADSFMYRTGDLARWSAEGELLFEGRGDNQVKVRGYRIELGEIESVMLAFSGIEEVKVLIKTGEASNESELIAYYSGNLEDKDQLRKYLIGQLPLYMIPNQIVRLERFPLTVNGKVDTLSLLKHSQLKDTSSYTPPRTSIEHSLVEIWEKVLKVSPIGIHDNFFELGGHSLKATQIISSIYKQFGVDLPFGELFKLGNISKLAHNFSDQQSMSYEGIPRVLENSQYDVSHAQRRLWLIDQFGNVGDAYNIGSVYNFTEIDQQYFKRSLISLIDRHESLRTRFAQGKGEVHQVIDDALDLDKVYSYVDLSSYSSSEQSMLIAGYVSEPFDLTVGPLLRCYLLKLSDSSYKVVLALHHIISDGWSMNILERDFGAIYNSYLTGAELDLPDLRIQYKDYTHWQNKEITSGGLAVDRSYWMDRLSGELPTLELPTDYSRPSVMSYKGATLRGVIPKERVEILETLSHSFGGTLFMGLTAVLYGLLHRYSGQEDIILGTPIAGRNHPDLSDQVGFYVNTLCLRLGIRGVDSFEELLQRVVEMMLESYDHQSYPFDLLIEDLDVRHDLSRSPLFDIMVVKGEDLTKGGSFEQNSDLQISKFDMTVTYQKYGDDVLIHLNYNSDIYDHHRIQQMIDHLQGFLLSVTSSPSQELRYVDYLTTSERECLLQSFNGSVTANGDTGLPTVLDKMRSNHTGLDNSLALISGDTEISYGLLHSRSNQLACHLHSRGDLHSGDLIGVIMGRTERMVISILGILKGGFVYVPIDPNYPESRKDYIISDSGLKLVITDLQFESSSVDVLQIPDVPEWDSLDSDYLAVDINSNDGAYVIYTSGSTGNPKGVLVEHGSLMNLCNWYIENVDLDNGSNSTFYTSIGFDASIVEIWPNLVAGARLHILSEELRHDIGLLERYIVEEEITHCFLPTIVCEEFMTSYPSKNHKNTLFLTGGEKLTKAIPGYRLINCYGPTETTVMATSIKIADVQQLSLGRPLPNMQVYILDKNDQLMPIGYQGEICISGLGVSRGYLNRPDLTSSKFVPNPYDTEGMMYRTGDLGRWLKDGNLIFEGRKDNQVKVRGYRIELGEIESAILAFKGVNETKVLVTTGNTLSESELIAYYTGDLEDKDKLRTHLIEQLPLYMIPYQILKLEEFPLTAHGKVDVLSLSQYTRSVDNPSYTKASSSMENSLVEIWEEVLQVSPIGIHDNFFELGGHSLNATHVISRLYKLFGIDLPFADLFKLGTISKLARKLSDQESISYKGIPNVPDQSQYDLSHAQRRLWLIDQFGNTGGAYNIGSVYDFDEIDEHYFQQSLISLIDRHESLRTRFTQQKGRVHQVIEDTLDLDTVYFYVDLSSHSSAEQSTLITEFVSKPFNLIEGPLLRCYLLKLGNESYKVILVLHHIISDGWSMNVLERDFGSIYNSYLTDDILDLPDLRIQYKDYAHWQNEEISSGGLAVDRSYWLDRLSGELPTLELSADYSRPSVMSYRGATINGVLPKEGVEALEALSNSFGGTLFMGLTAVLYGLLHRYSGQEDIILGTPIAGRHHPDLSEQVGFYVNTLCLRLGIRGVDSFEELLQRVVEMMLESYDHQSYPFDLLVEDLDVRHDLSRSPLFDIMVAFEEPVQDLEDSPFDHVKIIEESRDDVSKFDMTISYQKYREQVLMSVNYNSDIYSHERIARMIDHMREFLLSATSFPSKELRYIDYLPLSERKSLLEQFNTTASTSSHANSSTVLDLIRRTSENKRDSIALVNGDCQMSYGLFESRSNQLAHYLHSLKSLRSGDLIGIMLNRTEWSIISILGILKGGFIYVPIDPQYPQSRKDYIIRDSGLKLIIVDKPLDAPSSVDVLQVEDDLEWDSLDTDFPAVNINSEDGAYVIYTSGSTGNPKGVLVEHGSLMNYVNVCSDHFNFTQADRVLHQASLSFDISVEEVFPILTCGGALVVMQQHNSDVEKLADLIKNQQITILTSTPLIVKSLNESADLPSLRQIICGGDVLIQSQIDNLFKNIEICNSYGPTECTVGATYHDIEDLEKASLIGPPIPNTQIHILDQNGRLMPIGYKGEICISGLGLARGYLNRPDLTDSRFLHNQDELNTRVYRTGDLGRWQEDGNLSFEGRMDDQVKVRGYRIELGEIESSMLSMPEIRDVKVMVNNSEGDNEINAFFTGDSIDQDMVRTYLLDKIPAYMIPSRIVHLAEFPRTNNGKIDKDALSKHVHTKGSSSYTSPNTDLEKSLVKIWEEVLQVSPIGVHDNFFELGGHSIKATQIVLRLYQETGSNLSLGKIFKYPTIKKLADLVFDNQEGESDSGLLHLNTHLKNKPNLYMIPPILGSVTVYREFAERMDSKINCIGLQNKLFTNKDELPESVENMAEEFERRILNSQKTDQIFILGYSFGGLIAYDLTKRLELSGLKVKLILVDIPEPDAEMDLDISEDLKEELFNSEITPWLENFDSSEVEKLKRLYFNNLELSSKYTLRSKLSSDILAFEARYNEVSADMVQWKQHTSGNFIIETVDADHFGIFKDPDQDLLFPVEEFLEMYPIRA